VSQRNKKQARGNADHNVSYPLHREFSFEHGRLRGSEYRSVNCLLRMIVLQASVRALSLPGVRGLQKPSAALPEARVLLRSRKSGRSRR
ncbi:MAG: hypothetical protein WA002_18130, partial [Candidatus Acidiferrales bacterium]